MNIFVVLLFILTFFSCYKDKTIRQLATENISGTEIENNEEIYGVWNKENSPYIINGIAIVPQGKELIIEKGVIIKLKTGTYVDYTDINFDMGLIIIEGNIKANGTKSEPIIFTRNGNRGNWGIIYINSNDRSNIFNYTIFEYANKIENISKDSEDNRGTVSLYESKCEFDNCLFRNNSCFSILEIVGANCDVSYCTFSNNGAGIVTWFDSYVTVDNSIFWENGSTFFSYTSSWSSPIEISYSLIQDNNDDGIKTREMITDNGGNVFNINPSFTDDNYMVLSKNSPCNKMSSNGGKIGAFQK
jgi:hypothetical protein